MAPLAGYSYEFFNITSPVPFVAHVEINRPKKLNAFAQPQWLEFGRIFQQLSEDQDVRAVVLSGAGDRAFTSGLDVTAASQGPLSGEGAEDVDVGRKGKVLREHIIEFQDCISQMEKCAKPVICVMHGISLGLAMDIACCADIRIAADKARIAVKEVDIGLAADIGTLARLPKIVGSTSWVKDVCMSARDFTAQEALSVGFVSQVHETKAKALEAAVGIATRLAEKSPIAVQGTKEVLNHARDNSVAENLRYTQIWNALFVQSADVPAAMMASMQKTKPTFAKL